MFVKVITLVCACIMPFVMLLIHSKRQAKVNEAPPHDDRFSAVSRLWILSCQGIIVSTILMLLCAGAIYLADPLWRPGEDVWSFLIMYVFFWYGLTLLLPAIEFSWHEHDYIAFSDSLIEYKCGKEIWKVDPTTTSVSASLGGFRFRTASGNTFSLSRLSIVGFQQSARLWERLEQVSAERNFMGVGTAGVSESVPSHSACGSNRERILAVTIAVMMVSGILGPFIYSELVYEKSLPADPVRAETGAFIFGRPSQGVWLASSQGIAAALIVLAALIALSFVLSRTDKEESLKFRYWLIIVIGGWVLFNGTYLRDQYMHRGDRVILSSDTIGLFIGKRVALIPYAQIETMNDRTVSVGLVLKSGSKVTVSIERLGGKVVFFKILSEMVTTYRTHHVDESEEG